MAAGAILLTPLGDVVGRRNLTLLVEAGLSANEGITGGALLNLGGIFGAAILGVAAARFALKRVLIAYTVLAAVMLLVFVPATGALALAFVLGRVIGLFSNGCVAGLYAIAPSAYPASVRATGVGWALGVGRIGAILAPLIAGRRSRRVSRRTGQQR